MESIDFGDCEIRAISFEHPDVIVKLFDPNINDFFALEFLGCAYFIIESGSVQNVVGSIILFNSADEAFSHEDFKMFAEDRNIDVKIRNDFFGYKLCLFSVIAGGDFIIVFSDLSINRKRIG
ncbi:hypothetical protein [Phyllobacterium endophyticum]|uniref:hypothetical protein n=1 Tax=Phyllobacterium endophyticum TaxID=1149773 RepID=UPI0011C8898B|nr:hypothetical protein [Phyllobacterium endophyticum]TXR49865.1 hypothetical protein FVA77_07565 [Phyllobacterium endophyticum]